MIYAILVLLLSFLFAPAIAHAWGPGAHLEYALNALAHVASLAPVVAKVLKKHPNDFLYGNLAADIILGKKYAGDLHHCHHWDVALPLLQKAEDERQEAFIYGYLTHLSVDTVAHNYFVPYHIIKSYEAYTLRHTYWEMRFDLKMSPKVWPLMEELAKGDYHRNDILLSSSLKKALFSFKTTKRIFDSLLLVQRMHRWQKAAKLMTERSSYSLTNDDVDEFRQLCFEVSLDFLRHPTHAKAFQANPTGESKLAYAKEMVSQLKRYSKRHLISEESVDHLLKKIRKSLREGIYKPHELPSVYDAV